MRTKSSSEIDKNQIKMAKKQGRAYLDAIDYMIEEIADYGDRTEKGDYILGYTIDNAKGLYFMDDGDLEWENPGEENIHLEIMVADEDTGRFIPYLNIEVIILDDGEVISSSDVPFVWHPGIYHYGVNLDIPEGDYTLRVGVDPAGFPRHDRENGERYLEPIDIEFDIDIN